MSISSVSARNALARCVLEIDAKIPKRRPRRLSSMDAINTILLMCRIGCQWSSLPCPSGISYKTVYHRFNLWSRQRVFEKAFYALVSVYRTREARPLIADTTSVKNVYGHDVIGRNYADRGRFSTKVSVLTDTARVPLAFSFHCGNRNDCMTLHHLLNEAARKTGRPLSVHGQIHADKGYDSALCRSACRAHGLTDHIPRRGSGPPGPGSPWEPERLPRARLRVGRAEGKCGGNHRTPRQVQTNHYEIRHQNTQLQELPLHRS